MDTLRQFLLAETGQDLVEYSLVIVFVLIATAVFVGQTGSAVIPLWTAGSSTTREAALAAS